MLLLSCLEIACGEHKPDSNDNLTFPEHSPYPPSSHYYFDDPACQEQPTQALMLENGVIFSQVRTGDNFELAPQNHDLSALNIRTSPQLSTPHVSWVTVGGKHVRRCPEGPAQCLDRGSSPSWEKQKEPFPLKLCESQINAGRETFEGIGLASIFNLESALARAEALGGVPIAPLGLEVLPHYISSYLVEKDGEKTWFNSYFTRNMAYFPSSNKIAVFPESEGSNAYYESKGHLWESPFPLAHEVGHHIEQQAIAGMIGRSTFTWDPLNHRYLSANLEEEKALIDALTATSEGFADVIGYILAGENSDAVDAVDGLSDRNPTSGTILIRQFVEPKILTKELYDSYVACPGCTAISNHAMGAILAHGVYLSVIATAEEFARLGSRDALQWHYVIAERWMKHNLYQFSNAPILDGTAQSANLFAPLGLAWRSMIDELIQENQAAAQVEVDINVNNCKIFKEKLPLLQTYTRACESQ
jgi:hypothetical protein